MQLPEDNVKSKYDALSNEMLLLRNRRLPVRSVDKVKLNNGFKKVIDGHKGFFGAEKGLTERLADVLLFYKDVEIFRNDLLSGTRLTFNNANSVVACTKDLLDELTGFILAVKEEIHFEEEAEYERITEEYLLDDDADPTVFGGRDGESLLVDSEALRDYAEAFRLACKYLDLPCDASRSLSEMVQNLIARLEKSIEERLFLKAQLELGFALRGEIEPRTASAASQSEGISFDGEGQASGDQQLPPDEPPYRPRPARARRL